MKIYTKTGDDGTTGLFGGSRVSKTDARIEAYGTVDELSAALGLTVAALTIDSAIRKQILQIQNELFVIGAILATPDPANTPSIPRLDETAIARLEGEIDAADAQLPALKNFILPGGSESAARLHMARTICRRCERAIVELAQSTSISGTVVIYLNRLSDWLFIQARLANQQSNVADIPWA